MQHFSPKSMMMDLQPLLLPRQYGCRSLTHHLRIHTRRRRSFRVDEQHTRLLVQTQSRHFLFVRRQLV